MRAAESTGYKSDVRRVGQCFSNQLGPDNIPERE